MGGLVILSTSYVLIVFAVVIVLMIVLISKCKVNAAFGILIAAMILAIALKTPWTEIEGAINGGFASTIESVAIVIFLGCTMGTVLGKDRRRRPHHQVGHQSGGRETHYLGHRPEFRHLGHPHLG